MSPPAKCVCIRGATTALLVGHDTGSVLSFLADVPLDARGKVPRCASCRCC
jgi:hypothetical protein